MATESGPTLANRNPERGRQGEISRLDDPASGQHNGDVTPGQAERKDDNLGARVGPEASVQKCQKDQSKMGLSRGGNAATGAESEFEMCVCEYVW